MAGLSQPGAGRKNRPAAVPGAQFSGPCPDLGLDDRHPHLSRGNSTELDQLVADPLSRLAEVLRVMITWPAVTSLPMAWLSMVVGLALSRFI